jgi:hypothetical protein
MTKRFRKNVAQLFQCDQTFCEKTAHFRQKIAQNGALLANIFLPKKFQIKICKFTDKRSKNLELIKVNFGRYFRGKNVPKWRKFS